MASIKEEIAAIAADHGYTGPKPKSTAGAIDALADTLAGTDVKGSRSIAGAIHALAPYIGTGGGGTERVELFNETATTTARDGLNAATLAFTGNITYNPLHVVFDGTEYELPRSETTDAVGTKLVTYGAPFMGPAGVDFSTYPLTIYKDPTGSGWLVFTETAGTYTIVAYTEKSSGGVELGDGYQLQTDVAAMVFASDKPLDSSLDTFGAKLAVGINANARDQLMPAGLYVAMVIPNATMKPTVSGVDATIDGPSGSMSAYTVYFKMPSNAVRITATK